MIEPWRQRHYWEPMSAWHDSGYQAADFRHEHSAALQQLWREAARTA